MERITQNAMGGRPSPVDRDPARRPGVPMMPEQVEAYKDVAGKPIAQQTPGDEVLMGVEARLNVGADLTPVFGDTVAPKGLSGLIRKAAYKYPEHHAARWLTLMLGDRVDVWESRITRHPFRTAAVLAALVIVLRPRGR